MKYISFAIPCYNSQDYMAHAIESILPGGEDVEIIIVNDGSKDRTSEIAHEYMEKYPEIIRVVDKENGGHGDAVNAGLNHAQGKYFKVVDSDDWVDLNMLEEMSEYLTGSEKEMIASDYVIEKVDGSKSCVFQELPPGEYDRDEIERKVIPNLLGREKRYVTISRCMKLISRKLIIDNMKYSDPRIRLSEDTTIMLPSLIDCDRLVIMDHKTYYHYLYVNESMVHKYDEKLYANIRLLKETVLHIINDKFEGEELEERKKQLDQEYIFWLLLVLKNEARGNPAGYRKNIMDICKTEEICKLVKSTPVEIRQSSNKLLYLVLKHPCFLTVSLLRLAMIWYYRRG